MMFYIIGEMKMKPKKCEWKNGYSDGSGKGTITFNNIGKLRVHWGCGCCDSFDSNNTNKEEKKLIRLADKIVKILNKNKVR